MAEIVLTDNSIALVDYEDLELLLQYKWEKVLLYNTWYARCTKEPRLHMHQMVLGKAEGENDIDHIDHNGLNNQKNNLREVTHSINLLNRSGPNSNSSTGIRGIYYSKKTKKYRARVKIMYIEKEEWFNTLEEAIEGIKKLHERYI